MVTLLLVSAEIVDDIIDHILLCRLNVTSWVKLSISSNEVAVVVSLVIEVNCEGIWLPSQSSNGKAINVAFVAVKVTPASVRHLTLTVYIPGDNLLAVLKVSPILPLSAVL